MTGNVYQDTFSYVQMLAPVIIILGGLAFADIVSTMIIKTVKQSKLKKKR